MDPDDELIWAGRPAYRRRRAILGLIISIFVVIDLVFLRLYGIASNSALFTIAFFLLITNLFYVAKNEGVRYIITKRLIILERSLLFLRRTRQIRIDDLKDTESKSRNRLLFRPTTGKTIVFNLLKTDIARVEGITLKARNELKAQS